MIIIDPGTGLFDHWASFGEFGEQLEAKVPASPMSC